MMIPRALDMNPGKKRVFKVLVHQDQARPNPVPERLRIDNASNVLLVLSKFEGAEWVHKQFSYPRCQKCVLANNRAWHVLQDVIEEVGPKAKGVTVGMILDGGGRIEGAKHTGHWYQVDPDGYIKVERGTVDKPTRAAMRLVGIEST
jgi:hypothetical protein